MLFTSFLVINAYWFGLNSELQNELCLVIAKLLCSLEKKILANTYYTTLIKTSVSFMYNYLLLPTLCGVNIERSPPLNVNQSFLNSKHFHTFLEMRTHWHQTSIYVTQIQGLRWMSLWPRYGKYFFSKLKYYVTEVKALCILSVLETIG